jgi:lysophospholipase L1-like esterase
VTTLPKHVVIAFFCIVNVAILGGCGDGSVNDEAKTANDEADPAQLLEKLPGALIIVGDSIMAGCAESINQPRPDYTMTTAHLVAQKGVRVVNLSNSGASIWTAETKRVDGGINFTQGGKHGTAIWITLGTNDFIWDMSTLEQYRDRYLTVLSRIEPIPAQKIFCVTPLMSGFDYAHRTNTEGATLEDYRQIVRDIAAAGHCALVDTSQWFNSADISDECHLPDQLHLGEDGHIDYSEYLLEEVRDDYSTL